MVRHAHSRLGPELKLSLWRVMEYMLLLLRSSFRIIPWRVAWSGSLRLRGSLGITLLPVLVRDITILGLSSVRSIIRRTVGRYLNGRVGLSSCVLWGLLVIAG